MKEVYIAWIDIFYPTPESAISKCLEACKAMAKTFPNLTITNGFILLSQEVNNPRMHWWLVDTEDGQIVDPTANQYLIWNAKIVSYQEIDNNHPARKYPLCRCMNCGIRYYLDEEIGKNSNICSDICEKEFTHYFDGN